MFPSGHYLYPQAFNKLKAYMCTGLLFTFPSALPGSVRSVVADRQGRAPTDRSLPTPPPYAPTLCPTPAQEEQSGLVFLEFIIL